MPTLRALGDLLAHRLLAAALATVLAVPFAVAVVLTWTDSPQPEPTDFGYFGPAGAALLTGDLPAVYRDSGNQGGPFELIVFGVARLLGVHGVLGWTLFCTIAAALTAGLLTLVLHPGRSGGRRGGPIAVGVALLGCATASVPNSWTVGHPAEVLIPILWVVAARLALAGRATAAAAAVGLAAGFEIWGALGAPVVLLAARVPWARAGAAGAGVLALLYAPFAVTGSFAMFSFHWTISPWTLVHAVLPDLTTFPWGLRLLQAAVTVGVAALLARAVRHSREAAWLVPLGVVAVRLLLDPLVLGYYWATPLLLALVAVHGGAQRRSLLIGATGAAALLAASVPGYQVPRAVALLLLVAASAVVVRFGARRTAALRARLLASDLLTRELGAART